MPSAFRMHGARRCSAHSLRAAAQLSPRESCVANRRAASDARDGTLLGAAQAAEEQAAPAAARHAARTALRASRGARPPRRRGRRDRHVTGGPQARQYRHERRATSTAVGAKGGLRAGSRGQPLVGGGTARLKRPSAAGQRRRVADTLGRRRGCYPSCCGPSAVCLRHPPANPRWAGACCGAHSRSAAARAGQQQEPLWRKTPPEQSSRRGSSAAQAHHAVRVPRHLVK